MTIRTEYNAWKNDPKKNSYPNVFNSAGKTLTLVFLMSLDSLFSAFLFNLSIFFAASTEGAKKESKMGTTPDEVMLGGSVHSIAVSSVFRNPFQIIVATQKNVNLLGTDAALSGHKFEISFKDSSVILGAQSAQKFRNNITAPNPNWQPIK